MVMLLFIVHKLLVISCISGFSLVLIITLPKSFKQEYSSDTETLIVDAIVASTKLLTSISIDLSCVVIGLTKFALVSVNV